MQTHEEGPWAGGLRYQGRRHHDTNRTGWRLRRALNRKREGSTDTVTAWGLSNKEGDWKKVSTQSPGGDLFT